MSDFDLILRQGTTAEGAVRDFGVKDDKIAAVAESLSGSTAAEVDLSGQHIYPGFIDAHVHFNEPGRADWEGLETGSRALAAGGGTVFCDMPLNSSPPLIDPESLYRKRALAEKKSCIDFGLWGGMVPHNLDQLPGLAKEGVVGVKAFMANSGLEEFPRVNLKQLEEGMSRCSDLGLLVALHAESQELIDQFEIQHPTVDIETFLLNRSPEIEREAIHHACRLAGKYGTRLHIVHVSSEDGIEEIEEAKRRGVDVTAETCPHYLFFTSDDLAERGTILKCTPPLRKPDQVDRLKQCLLSGKIDTVGSDHSPSPPGMKKGDFADAWGGISSCQHAFPAFLAEYRDNWKQITENPARRMGLFQNKGSLEVGKDADFAVVDFSSDETVGKEELLYRHAMSPYIGRTINCRVTMTICRGRIVYSRKPLSEEGQKLKRIKRCKSRYLARQEPS